MKTYSLRATKLLLALGLSGLAPLTRAAGFDCAKASSTTEKLVCSEARTSALDGKLQQAYRTALRATDASGKKALAKEQRNWIKYTRGICQDTFCLQRVYTARISVLARNEKSILDDEPYCAVPSSYKGHEKDCGVNAQVYRDPNGHIESFNRSLAQEKNGGRIIGCRRLIDTWNGTHIGPGRGEETFGGTCVLQEETGRRNVKICNDEMWGSFQVQPINSRNITDKQLIDFTYACGRQQ